ncbi:PucR C-terminal helix-turn-helix domain-containing protein [Actinomadura glauciflava]|uniref:helix-turn-helix domain-containing protein n=1 Tax=Actinomadura luteofluorescens TaxID=46163 RepID=UPI00216414AA|nr:helix-turn-helix domain-containing protein [Actinomadura glauciflava]MCR3738330.1 PucR C-terminal helix-turn-helix domain-containing protein [Actinomadura glauciflava]
MAVAHDDADSGPPVLDGLADEPWRDVPAEEARWMRPRLPGLLGVMVEGVLRHVPEYDRPGDAAYWRVAEAAVAKAMEHFVQMIADPDTSWKEVYQVYFDVGYGEAVEGRSLEHLQNAMRVGSRLAWRHLAVEAERLGRPPALVSLLAEANFAYLDALASAAAHGYARAREKAAGEREQRRGRLLALLLADPPAPPEVVREQAARAGWPLPRRLAVIVLRARPGSGGEGPAGLPPSLLTGLDHGRPCLVMPDPDGPGRLDELAATLAGWTGAVGPSVPAQEAGTSLLWARRALDLAPPAPPCPDGPAPGRAGRRSRRGGLLVRAEEHLPGLLLREGATLAALVAARRLAPLDALGPRQGRRLAVTLLECMKHGFNATGAAEVLRVHPQTVRYRLAQLHEMFGFDIEDPEIRLEMMLLLHTWIQRRGG